MMARGKSRPLEALAYGLLWGGALLVAPALLPVGVALAMLAAGAQYNKNAVGIQRALACWFAGTVLVLSPWIVRNYYTLGGFVWGRDNFGLELSLSNGPGAHWSNPLNRPRIFSMHPSRYLPAAQHLAAVGELAFNRERSEEARLWIRQNPGEFARLTAQRLIHFWFPSGRNTAHQVVLALFTLLAFAGLAMLRNRPGPGAWIVAAVWLSYPLAYYLIQWSSRYRLPIDWSLILCAALPLYEAWRRLRHGAEA
jgi:hypothetical protein